MFSQKHQLLTAAVLAALSLTACGKKQDLYSPPPEAQAKAEDPAKKSTPKKKADSKIPASPRSSKQSSSGNENSEPDLGGGLDESDDDGTTGSLPEPGSSGTARDPYGTKTPPAPTPRNSFPDSPVDVADVNPAPRERSSSPPPYEPSENSGNKYTGGTAKDGLLYTASAPDSLLEFLKARNARVDSEIRRDNLALATSVSSANLSNDNGNVVVTLNLIEDGQVKKYVLVGDARSGSATKLQLQDTDGSRAADGTLKCVDADGDCENIFARLRIGTPGTASIVSVVFRTSGANLFFDLPKTNSGSYEYQTLRQFMRNTVSKVGDRIATSRMASYEVVNGRSGFEVTMKGNNGETLAYSGALVAGPEDSRTELNVTLDANSRTDYAKWITGSRLVSNDTNGRLNVRLTVSSGEHFVVKFARQVKPIVDLNDDNLR